MGRHARPRAVIRRKPESSSAERAAKKLDVDGRDKPAHDGE
jgi:hypothetical protein